MPIKPENVSRYPKDWKHISASIRKRSGGQCECVGECGLHPDHRCVERNSEPALWAKGKIVLTVAHLNHQPEDCDEKNLKAMCQRCHLRYDHEHHQRNAHETRRAKKRTADMFALKDGSGG